jgi:acyl-coenzyme A thioesterase PaaI-like protein
MGLTYVLDLRRRDPEAAPGGAVTVSLTVDYVAAAALGQWLEVRPRLLRAGRGMGFVDALVAADGETAARASAAFRAR